MDFARSSYPENGTLSNHLQTLLRGYSLKASSWLLGREANRIFFFFFFETVIEWLSWWPLAWHGKPFANNSHLICSHASIYGTSQGCRGMLSFPLALTRISCSPKIKPLPHVWTALSFTKRSHEPLIWRRPWNERRCRGAYFTCKERILSTDLVLWAALTQVEYTAPGREGSRCDAHGRSLSPGRQGVPRPPLSCLGRRPRDGGLSGSPGPLSLSVRARPHTSKCLTLSSSGSPSDLAGQRPEGPGNPAAATALQGLGPTLLGDSGGSHQKVGGSRERKPRLQSSSWHFPSQPEHHPLPLPRLPCGSSGPAAARGCGYLEGGKAARKGSSGEAAGLPGCAETTIPSRQRGRRRRQRRRAGWLENSARAAGMERW